MRVWVKSNYLRCITKESYNLKILRNVDRLLGNDREISKDIIAVTKYDCVKKHDSTQQLDATIMGSAFINTVHTEMF
jgi:hypothetical protein